MLHYFVKHYKRLLKPITNLALLLDVIKKFSSGSIFHNHKDVSGGTDYLVPGKRNQIIGKEAVPPY